MHGYPIKMTSSEQKKYRVLVVDDEKDVRTVLSQMVEYSGFDCLVASSGEQALKILEKYPVDVVITDIVMPGMGGIQLTREATQKFDVDAIVVTGHTRDYTFEQITGNGARDFITKPIRTNELITRLKRVIKERETARERDRAEKALIMSEHQLRSLTSRLKEVEEEMRKWIARELHDCVGQNLSALNLNLSLLNSHIPDEMVKKTGPIFDDSMRLLSETAEHIRDVMARLRPVGLDDYGLASAINGYVERFVKRTGIHVDVQAEEYEKRLPLDTETQLFRITQEALTNILKHAEAQKVTVSIKPMDNRVRLTISDNGIGFDTDSSGQTTDHSGWGLISMKERANSLNGKFKVISEPGDGTIIVVEVNHDDG